MDRAHPSGMQVGWTPELQLVELEDRCRLSLGDFAVGDGRTLQEAADDLVMRLLSVVMTVRAGGLRWCRELGLPDPRWWDFVAELGHAAENGEDIRERIFGTA